MTVREVSTDDRANAEELPCVIRDIVQIVQHFGADDILSEISQALSRVVAAKPLLQFWHEFGEVMLSAFDRIAVVDDKEGAAIIFLLNLRDDFIAIEDLITDHLDRMLNDKGVMSR